jgi:hypothetical protein
MYPDPVSQAEIALQRIEIKLPAMAIRHTMRTIVRIERVLA